MRIFNRYMKVYTNGIDTEVLQPIIRNGGFLVDSDKFEKKSIIGQVVNVDLIDGEFWGAVFVMDFYAPLVDDTGAHAIKLVDINQEYPVFRLIWDHNHTTAK